MKVPRLREPQGSGTSLLAIIAVGTACFLLALLVLAFLP